MQDSAQPPDRQKTRAELAKVAGVSHDTIAKAKFLRDNADDRTKEQLRKGEVLRPHILYRHRDRAGFHIGDGRHVDLIRYAAWLIQERRRPKPARSEPDYEAMKESARARNARLSAIGRDIGDITEVQHPRLVGA